VHLLLGLPGLVLWRTIRGSLAYGVLVAVAYGGALAYGLLAIGESWDVLSLNTADNLLHLALALGGAVIAGAAWYERRSTAPGRRTTLRRGTGYPRPDAA
jgi:hypothetical protein